MIQSKGIVFCAIALLFTTASYAQEKSPAQATPAKDAVTQVATAVKTTAAPEAGAPAVKKGEEARPAACCMKSGCMGCGKMVAAENGGVIILMGNRLYKYDANLTLVKTAEIKQAVEPVKKTEKAPEAKPADAKK